MTTPATPNVFVGSTDDTSEGGLFVSTSSTNLATEAPETSSDATIAIPDSFTGSTDNAADGSLFTDVNVSSVADIKITKIIAGTGLVGTSLEGPVPTLNIDNTIVTLTGTQTLTNKTINIANNTITIASTDLSDASSIDAATLDSIDSSSFLRSDVADTKTAGDLSFDDNIKAVFGTGSDLTIHHEPGFSIIREQNANSIFIQTDNTQYGVSITKKFGTESMARFIPDGEVTLYHNNVAKFSTTATGASVVGTLAGDLTGDVTGNLTGDVTGNVTGDLTGDVTGAVTTKTSTGGVLELQRSGTSVLDNDEIGSITFTAPDTTYASPNIGSTKAFEIMAEATDDYGQYLVPTKLSFRATDQQNVTSNLLEVLSVNPDGSISLPVSEAKLRFHSFQSDYDESFIGRSSNGSTMYIRNSASPITDFTYYIYYQADNHIFQVETGGGYNPTYDTAFSIRRNVGANEDQYVKTESNYPLWIEDAGNGVGSFYIGSTFTSSNRVNTTAAELNMLDGSAKSTTSITINDADAFVIIDDTTTKQIPASDISSYVKGTGTTTPVKEAGLETIWIPASSMIPFDSDGLTLERINTTGNSYPQIEAFKINSTLINTTKFADFSVGMPKSWNRGSFTAEHYFYNKSGSNWTVSNFYIRAANWKSGSTVPTFPGASNISSTTIINNTVTAISSGTFSASGSTNTNGTNLIMFQAYKSSSGIGSAEYYYFGTKIFFTTNAKNDT